MRIRRLASVLIAAALATTLGGALAQADATTGPPGVRELAKAQTRLYAAYDGNTGVSPTRCGQGQRAGGVLGTFLLPVLAGTDTPEPKTIRCRTTARKVLVDAGGFAITEDANGPSYPLPFPDGDLVAFNRANLNAICDDVVAHLMPSLGIPPAVVTVDGNVRETSAGHDALVHRPALADARDAVRRLDRPAGTPVCSPPPSVATRRSSACVPAGTW